MQKIIVLIVFLNGIVTFLNAQINDNFTLNSQNIIIQQNGSYDIVSIKNCSYTEEAGNPQLPVKIISYLLPYNSTVTSIDVSVTLQKLQGNYYIFPAQPERYLDGSDPPAFVEPNLEVYNSNTPYPSNTVEIINDGYTHGYHVVTVKIYPVEYHPTDREIYLRDINFTINYSGSFDSRLSLPFTRQSHRRYELGKQFVQNIVKNVDDIEGFRNKSVQIVSNAGTQYVVDTTRGGSTSAIDTLVPDYIIITNNELKPIFQQLADWKTKKGMPAIIKTIEEIEPDYQGSDLQEKIRNYLKEAYITYGANLFVLLGGDVNVIPERLYRLQHNGQWYYHPIDIYYATVGGTWNANSNDIFGESDDGVDYNRAFFLGRAPSKDVTQAQIFVDKIISYEKFTNISNASYVNNFLCMSAFLSYNTCDSVYSCNFSNELKNIPYPSNIQKWFLFDNYNCSLPLSSSLNTPTYNIPRAPYGPYAAYHNPNNDYSYGYDPGNICKPNEYMPKIGDWYCNNGSDELNKTNAMSCLNNGGTSGLGKFHLVYHIDHSKIRGMGMSSKNKGQGASNSDFDGLTNLTNGNYHQILFTNGCEPNTFHYDCISKHYVNNPIGGGVAFIGYSAPAGYGSHKEFKNFCTALYNTNGNFSNGYHLGVAYNAAQAKIFLTLLGDPEMPVWTATPNTIKATTSLDQNIGANGERTIKVNITNGIDPSRPALICVQKGDEYYATKSVSANGTYNFKFIPQNDSFVNITITGKNYKPYEGTIHIAVDKSVVISNFNFYDGNSTASIGNGDYQLDAGETIELDILLQNKGYSTVSNVETYLSCNSQYITILNDYSAFNDILYGNDIQTSLSKYKFKIAANAPEILLNNLNQIKFVLKIYTNVSSHIEDFNIDIYKPEIELGNKIVYGTIAPNATIDFDIDLFNKGKAEATEISAVLTSNCSIINNYATYPSIGKYKTEKNNPSSYQITIPPNYSSSTPIKCTLQITNQYGKIWNYTFNLDKRPDKIPSLDFNGDTTSIKLTWTPLIPLKYIKGYNIYRCFVNQETNEKIGDFEKINAFTFPAAFYNDAGLEKLTKYYYKVSAIDTAGNEGPLSDSLLAWTSYSLADTYPITMSVGSSILGSINVADVNDDGQKEIFTTITASQTEGYIIGLNSDGTELFNIDNNVTTYSGFAKLAAKIDCTPAIGDINNDGTYEIITMTRHEGSGSNYYSYHSTKDLNLDGKPDLLWQKTYISRGYRAPMLADINNDGYLGSGSKREIKRIY